MITCIVCKTPYKNGSGISFHKFPKDGTLYLWLKNLNIDRNFSPLPTHRICSKHFTPDCFEKHMTRTSLKYKSIPTLFCSKIDVATGFKGKQNTHPQKGLSEVWGDVKHDHSYQSITTSSEKATVLLRKKLKVARARIKALSQRVKRLKNKIANLKDINRKLGNRKVISDTFVDMLEENNDVMSQLYKRIFDNSRQNLSHAEYPKELRTFALTLYAFSAQAYVYVRKKFNLALPHPRMVRSWHTALNTISPVSVNINSVPHLRSELTSVQDDTDPVNTLSAAKFFCEFTSVEDGMEHVNSCNESENEFTFDQETEHVNEATDSPNEFTVDQDGMEQDNDTETSYNFSLNQEETEHDSVTESPNELTVDQYGMGHVISGKESPNEFTIDKNGTEHDNDTESPCIFSLDQDETEQDSDTESTCIFSLIRDRTEHDSDTESPSKLSLDQDGTEHDSDTESTCIFSLIRDGPEHDSDAESPSKFCLIQDGTEHDSETESPCKFSLIQDETDHDTDTESPCNFTLIRDGMKRTNAAIHRRTVTKQNRKKKNNVKFKMGALRNNLILKYKLK